MATPAIALRFRDTTPGIDTISEHRVMLARNGAVGWGWWKKVVETADEAKLAAFNASGDEKCIVLIDRSAEKLYLCGCRGFSASDEVDPALVPDYYRDHLGETAGVFTLRSIEEIPYDHALGNAIGDLTLLWIGSQADPSLGHVAEPARAPGRSCVLHLSDLHFGADYGFRVQGEDLALGDGRRTLTECIMSDLERLGMQSEIAAIIVTGDFMTHGLFNDATRRAAIGEFNALRAQLGLEADQIIPVPGNHDVVRYGADANLDLRENAVGMQTTYEHERQFRMFVDELVGRDWKASLNYVRRVHLGDADLDICVINSCTIAATKWTEYGYVGRSGLDAISELGKRRIERSTFRILALHHHLLPVANVDSLNSKGVSLTLDASEILAAGQSAGVHIALHGHQHKPKIALYQNIGLNGATTDGPIFVVANGSAGVKADRLPTGERNTYALFRLDPAGIELWIRELRLDAVAGAEVYHGTLPTHPLHA